MLDFGNTRDYTQSFGNTPQQSFGASREFTQTRFGSREPTLTRMTVQEEEEEPELEEPELEPRSQQQRQTTRDQPRGTTRTTFMSRDYSIPSLQHDLNPGQDSLFAGVAREIESRDQLDSRDQAQPQSRDLNSSARPMRRNLRSVVVEPAAPTVPSVVVTQDRVTEVEDEEDTAPPITSLRETGTSRDPPSTSRDPSSTSRGQTSSTRRPSRLASGLESWQAEVSQTQAEGVSFGQTEFGGLSRDADRSRGASRSHEPEPTTSSSGPVTVSVPLNDEEPGDETSRARRGTPLPSRDRSRGSRAGSIGAGDRSSHDISISRDRVSPGGAPDSALEQSFEAGLEEEESREKLREKSREKSSHEKSFSNINYFTSNREKNKSFEAEEEEPEIESESGDSGEVEMEVESRDVDMEEEEETGSRDEDMEEETGSRDVNDRELSHDVNDNSFQSQETARSGDSTDSSRFRSRYLQDKLSRGAGESRESSEPTGRARDLLSEHRMADTSLDRIKASAIKKHSKPARDRDESRDVVFDVSTSVPDAGPSRDLLSEHRMADTSLDRIKASAIKKHTKQAREPREGDKSREDRSREDRSREDKSREDKSREGGQSREPRLPADLTMPNTSMAQIIEAAKRTHTKSARDAEAAAQKARDQEEHERKTAEARERVEREIQEKNARDQEKLARMEAARAERLAKRRKTDEGHVSVSHDRSHVTQDTTAEKSMMEPPHVTSKLRQVSLEPPKSAAVPEDDDDDMSIISELSEVDVRGAGGLNGSRERSREQPKNVSRDQSKNDQHTRDFTSRYGIPEFDETESSAQNGVSREAAKSREFVQPREEPRPRDTSGETTISQHTTTSAPASPDSTSRATDLGSPRDHGEPRDLGESRDLGASRDPGGINTHVMDNNNSSRDKPSSAHNRQNSILSPFDRATKASASSVSATNGKRRFSESRDPAHFESRDIATVNEWRSLDFLITSSLQQQVWSSRFRTPGNAVLRIPPSIRTCFPLVSEARLRDMIVAVVYCRQRRLKDRRIAGHRDRRKVSWWRRWLY